MQIPHESLTFKTLRNNGKAIFMHAPIHNVGKYRTDSTMSDPRRTRRPPPAWMAINRVNGLCWCGKPKELWDFGMRKYCCKRHADIWFDGICPLWSDIRIRIIERDGAKCTMCGKRGERGESSLNPYLMLHVDHIMPYAAGGDFWDWDNLAGTLRRLPRGQDLKGFRHDKVFKMGARLHPH